MKRRDFVKWSLAGTATLPLVDCTSAPPADDPGAGPELSAVSVSPGTVLGGAASTGTVTLSGPAPAGGAAVGLSSSNAAAQVPGTVQVAAGATTGSFTVTTISIASDTPVTITASYGGTTKTATLTVTAHASLQSVGVSPGTVVGGAASTGTVTLSGPAPAGGMLVGLLSDNAAAQVPGTVQVAAGATTGSFTVTTISVTADTAVTITASYGGATRTAAFTVRAQDTAGSAVFLVSQIANDALSAANRHQGVDALIGLMGENGLKFYRTSVPGAANGANGLIAADDVVLVKVNVQWKYRGCTNSDVVRGLVQRILEHPDGFAGEVVICDNGQGRGSLDCDTSVGYDGDTAVHANAQNESHSFRWLVEDLFRDPRVTSFLLDTIRGSFISAAEHGTNGYRRYENVSYPCFTTAGGRRVELKEGIWNGSSYAANLKLINVPVLKHHDWYGSFFTGALKHVYGIVSMGDGEQASRHYASLGETCGKMMVSVHTPVLNILDAIWVSHAALAGYPASATFRANRLVASQDPLALDYWAAKHILYPIDGEIRHDPDHASIDAWLTTVQEVINGRGGFAQAARGIQVGLVTKTESEMRLFEAVP